MSTPILSWSHWPPAWQEMDLVSYRAGHLAGGPAHDWLEAQFRRTDPMLIYSLSDADVGLWAYQQLAVMPGVQQEWLDKLCYTTGCFRGHDRLLWPLIDAALEKCDAWLVQMNWEIAACLSAAAMSAKGVQITPEAFLYRGAKKLKIDCEAMFSFVEQGRIFPALQGKRLAVLSGLAEKVGAALCSLGLEVAVCVPFPKSCHTSKLEFLPHILTTLFDHDWDLLLCSAGGLSPLFCDYAFSRGRQGVDMGSCDSLLVTGKRTYIQYD